ncbi:MAG: 30S ribosomal protein S2 [Alphaproteobacteria bacterium MarineAlpha5_Bin11]|nr:30S ribosomal protein S2 [Pelagibacteraceae bacterium]PPR42661.1 MAG: 30S ribosomal protein S2 [Alphaproteobacteria bacterium MarineAlpha5_Bin11]|tara:strand:+ start:5848 stop:6684 length:837 start_codon:yes stop_codon:yes gene_type:complete
MKLPEVNIQQLLEAGVHFGHHKKRWNPKMEQYIFGIRNNIHIIDLRISLPLIYKALEALYSISSKSGKILFVGTKKQTSNFIEEIAKKTNQYFITKRWFGGTLTNWNTISNSIERLKKLEEKIGVEENKLSKKELLNLRRERDKLNNAIGGIKTMETLPDLVVIFDTVKDKIAVQEAHKLSIPVLGIIDTNSDPENINYPIPGNDDAIRSINLYVNLFTETILNASKNIVKTEDVGSSTNPPEEVIENKEVNKISLKEKNKKKNTEKKIKKAKKNSNE